jgi:hypothetical protein
MHRTAHWSRRRWLGSALAGGAVALTGGALWLQGEPAPIATFPDTDAALRWLDAIARSPQAHSLSPWPLAQVLEHAAQSVEFSLDGYPQLRSALFRDSVGTLAFLAFARRGRMTHDTQEPIPGAPALVATRIDAAAARLSEALRRFEAQPATHRFAPHFAFGTLDKDAYRRAHLMHLADHAREIVRG